MTGVLPRRTKRSRFVAVILLGAALAASIVVGSATPANAHATLTSTDPAEGAVLDTQPDEIRFVFTEAVTLVPDGVQVYDATGQLVTSSAEVSGSDLTVALDETVGEGTLIVAWRLVSGDGHPISGALTFSIGEPSAQIAALPPGPEDGQPWWLSITRVIGYVALLLTTGLTAFLVLFLPADRLADRGRARLVRTARGGAVATVAAWSVALPLTVMYQFGGGPAALASGATWAALAPREYAVTGAVVLGVLAAMRLLGDGRRGRRRDLWALAAASVAVCAPAFTGHTRAATPEFLAISADALHLVAGGVWFGGLVALVLVLPDLAGHRGTLAADMLARFSTFAAGVLVALVATGGLLAWRIAGSWEVLFGTPYGWLLMVKVGVALVAVAIAAVNRFIVLPRIADATRRRDKRGETAILVRYTVAEAAALVVVLLVTGFLVETSPQSGAASASAAVQVQNAPLGDLDVRATLQPAATGPTTITIEMLDPAGEPTEGMEPPTVRLSTEDLDLGVIEVTSIGPGAYSAYVVLPVQGTWEAQVSLRIGEFENPVGVVQFEVRDRNAAPGS